MAEAMQTQPVMALAQRAGPQPVSGESDIEADWCFVSLYGTVENEHITEKEDIRQVTHNVANCISKELLCNPEDELLAETVDEIFKTFEEVADVDVRPLIQFWTAWRNQEYERHQILRKRASISTLSSVTSEHVNNDIIIALMVDLLRVSPDPEKIHLLWLKILTHFILESGSSPESLEVFLELKVAATVLGTMSAYRRSSEIQKYGCTALAVFAPVRPTPRRKAPLRESAIQVLTQSLMNHKDSFDVVKDACGIIAAVAEVMVHLPSHCIEQGYTSEETEKLCQSAGDILDCIRLAVMDQLENVSTQYSDIDEIQESVTKLLACFGCHTPNRRSSEPFNVFRPKSHTTPTTLKRVSFAGELEIIPGSSPSCTLSLGRGETFHMLRAEMEAEEEPHYDILDQERDGEPCSASYEDVGVYDDVPQEVSKSNEGLNFCDEGTAAAERDLGQEEHPRSQGCTTRGDQLDSMGEDRADDTGGNPFYDDLPGPSREEYTSCGEVEGRIIPDGHHETEPGREYSFETRGVDQDAAAFGEESSHQGRQIESSDEQEVFAEEVQGSQEEELSSPKDQGSLHQDQPKAFHGEQKVPYGEQQPLNGEEQMVACDGHSIHDYENVEMSQILERLSSPNAQQEEESHRDFTEEELRVLYDEEAHYENAQEIRKKLYHSEQLAARSDLSQFAREEEWCPNPRHQQGIFTEDGQVSGECLDHFKESGLMSKEEGSPEHPVAVFPGDREDHSGRFPDEQDIRGDRFEGYETELVAPEDQFQGCYEEEQAAFGEGEEVFRENQYQSEESDSFLQRRQQVRDCYQCPKGVQSTSQDFHGKQDEFDEDEPIPGEAQQPHDQESGFNNPPEPLQVFYEQKALFDENIQYLSQGQYPLPPDGYQSEAHSETFHGGRSACGGDADGEQQVGEFHRDQRRDEETHYREEGDQEFHYREGLLPEAKYGEHGRGCCCLKEDYRSGEDGRIEEYYGQVGYSTQNGSMELPEEDFPNPLENESSEAYEEADGVCYEDQFGQDFQETEGNGDYPSGDIRHSEPRSCDDSDNGANLEGDSVDQLEVSKSIGQGKRTYAEIPHGGSEEKPQACQREIPGAVNEEPELSLQDVIDRAAHDLTRRESIEREIAEEYRIQTEFDIVDTLVNAGLHTEEASCTETPKFPPEEDTPDGVGLDDTGFGEAGGDDVCTSSGLSRANSLYENIDNFRVEVTDVNGVRQWKGQQHHQQTSFDSGLGDHYDPPGDCDSFQQGHSGVPEGTGEWGSCRSERRFIDECVRMSRLSILTEDIEGAMWHDNEAFGPSATPGAIPELVVSGMSGSGSSLDSTSAVDPSASDPEGSSPYHADRSRTESSASGRNSSYSSGSYVPQHPMLGECRSMGSLDKLCSPRQNGRNDKNNNGDENQNHIGALKTMSCSHVSMVTPPPKPRRTWYYQSSQDVRRSLTRSAQPCYDGFENPVYDEPPKELYTKVSKPKKYRRSEPTYAKVQKKHLRPSSSESSNNTTVVGGNTSGVVKSGTSSSVDSGVELLTKKRRQKTRKSSHLYEDVRLLTDLRRDSQALSRYLEEDSSEATYEVCTLWVNGNYSEALETFNHLTQRLASLYSIVPEARKEENRRSALIDSPSNLNLEDDYPAWANILNVLALEVGKWTLSLMVKFLPIADRLFQVEDKNVLNAVIEVIKILVGRYGRDIMKNRNPSLFKTRFREDCRVCFKWLAKLHLRTEFLLTKRREKEYPSSLLHSSLLDSFAESLQPFSNSKTG